MKATQADNLLVVKSLLKRQFDVFYQVDGFFAIDYLEMDPENEDSYFEILAEFLKADSPFPKKDRFTIIPIKFVELNEFFKVSRAMHNAIMNRNLAAIKEIITKYPQKHYFCPSPKAPFKNISACQLATDQGYFSCLKLFKEKNVLLASFESKAEIYKMEIGHKYPGKRRNIWKKKTIKSDNQKTSGSAIIIELNNISGEEEIIVAEGEIEAGNNGRKMDLREETHALLPQETTGKYLL